MHAAGTFTCFKIILRSPSVYYGKTVLDNVNTNHFIPMHSFHDFLSYFLINLSWLDSQVILFVSLKFQLVASYHRPSFYFTILNLLLRFRFKVIDTYESNKFYNMTQIVYDDLSPIVLRIFTCRSTIFINFISL